MPIPRAYRNKQNAPWNASPKPECPDCQEYIDHPYDHEEGCELDGLDATELEEELDKQAAPDYEPGGL